MKISNYLLNQDNQFELELQAKIQAEEVLVLVFSNADQTHVNQLLKSITQQIPQATLLGCSTAGQIHAVQLSDDSISVCVIELEKSQLKKVTTSNPSAADSYAAGVALAQQLPDEGLKYVLLLSKGLQINGSQLAAGVRSALHESVVVTGGLAGDDDRFGSTWVINQHNQCDPDAITAVGFYGADFRVSFGSKGGWQPIGPFRTITASNDNTLIALDGQPALDIYAKYLGKLAEELPASGLLFPVAIFDQQNTDEFQVRTILGVNREQGSIEFAGDMPMGSQVRLMHASFDRLIDGAAQAGSELVDLVVTEQQPSLCLLISCVGRRLVLGQRTEEEIEEVVGCLPAAANHVGFYSYGEITPSSFGNCELHNQTMTLSLLWET